MEKAIVVSIRALKPDEEGDFKDDRLGTLEFIDKRIYVNVLDRDLNLDIEIGFNLDDLLAAMKEAFFDVGAD